MRPGFRSYLPSALDLDLARLRLRGARHVDFENAILVIRLNLVAVQAGRQGQSTPDMTEGTVAALLALVLALPGLDGQDVLGQLDVDVLDVEAGQLGPHDHLV